MNDLPITDVSMRQARPSRLRRTAASFFTPLHRLAERVFTPPVWGVARTSLSVLLRSSPAAGVMVILAAFLIWLPNMQSGGAALSGRVEQYMNFQDLLSNRVQQYLSLSLTLVYYLGAALVILLAAGIIVGEIQTRTVQLTLCKPLSRRQYVAGKALALALLTFFLVFGSGGIVAARVWWFTRQPAGAADRERLAGEVLTAREILPLAMPAKEVDEKLRQRKEQIQAERSEPNRVWTVLEEDAIRQELLTRFFSVPPGQAMTYTFHDLAPVRELKFFQIRYQLDASGQIPHDLLPVIFIVGDRRQAAQVRVEREDLVRVAHTFTVPAATIAADGTLAVTVINPILKSPERTWAATLNLPQKNGLAVLYQTGAFPGNFLRSLLLIWFFLLLLGSLGLFFSALVTYPVAVLCSVAGLLTLLLIPWVTPALLTFSQSPERNDWFLNWTLPLSRFLAAVVPDLSNLEPIDSLAGGILVPWRLVGAGLLKLVVLAGGLLTGLAIAGLYRRELAAAPQE